MTKAVYRLLKEHNITDWRSRRRKALTASDARVRLDWANQVYQIIDWDPHFPDRVCWSDEISVYQIGDVTSPGASVHQIGNTMQHTLALFDARTGLM